VLARLDVVFREITMRLASTYLFLLGAFLGTVLRPVDAAPPTFKIDSLYSNFDGSLQFIRLTETQGLDGQHHFAGLKLTVTHRGVTNEYTFPHDLATHLTAHASIAVVAARYSVPLLVNGGVVYSTYTQFRMPERFLPVDGGVVDFAGVDQMSFTSLPKSGVHAMFSDGSIGPALLPESPCTTFPCRTGVQIAFSSNSAIEYNNRGLDHYFITAEAAEIDALDSGRLPGWQRTGEIVPLVGARPPFRDVPGNLLPVCRYYIPPALGDSHFMSVSADECVYVGEHYPAFVLESEAAFYAAMPGPAGECPPPGPADDSNIYFLRWLPVFRLWNGRADTNHRYTTDESIRSAMIAHGWFPEGYGPDGIAFCSLQVEHAD
jgi:Repeat of unknown function (DUF5648)